MAENKTTRLAEIYQSEKSRGGGAMSTFGKAALEKIDPRRIFNQKGFLAAALPSLFKAYRATPDKSLKTTSPGLTTPSGSLSPTVFNSMNLNLTRIAKDINFVKQNSATLVKNQNKKTTGRVATKVDKSYRTTKPTKATEQSTTPTSESSSLKDIGLGALGSAMSGIGKGAGIAAIGVGIGGFIAGLALGGAAVNALGGASGIKDLLVNLAEGLNAFNMTSLAALGAMLGTGMLFGATAGVGNSVEAAVGMGVVGLGFGGFMAGLALGGAGVQLFGGATGVKDLLVNLAEGLNAFEVSSLAALGSLLGAGMLFGAVGGPAAALYGGIGIAAVGAGLGGFLAALALSGTAVKLLGGSDGIKELLINLAAGLNPLSQIDGTNLMQVGAGVVALTAGLAGLGAGSIFKSLKDFFFGESDPKKAPLYQLAEQLKLFKDIDGENLSKIGQGFKDLTSGIETLASMSDKQLEKARKNTSSAVGIARSASQGSVGSSPSQVPSTPGSSGDAEVDKILATIRQRESGGDYTIQAKGSSASGAYQFINSTWKGLTKQYGIGTEYPTAKDAPPEIQDAVASAYVKDILKKNNGDVSKVPLVWYTGNSEGKMSTAALAANNGLTAEAYQAKWMASYSGQGSQVAASPPKPTGAVIAQASTSVDEGRRNTSGRGNNNPTTINNNMSGGNGNQTTASIANPYDTELARLLTQGISA